MEVKLNECDPVHTQGRRNSRQEVFREVSDLIQRHQRRRSFRALGMGWGADPRLSSWPAEVKVIQGFNLKSEIVHTVEKSDSEFSLLLSLS